jgi:hypothetical protein
MLFFKDRKREENVTLRMAGRVWIKPCVKCEILVLSLTRIPLKGPFSGLLYRVPVQGFCSVYHLAWRAVVHGFRWLGLPSWARRNGNSEKVIFKEIVLCEIYVVHTSCLRRFDPAIGSSLQICCARWTASPAYFEYPVEFATSYQRTFMRVYHLK